MIFKRSHILLALVIAVAASAAYLHFFPPQAPAVPETKPPVEIPHEKPQQNQSVELSAEDFSWEQLPEFSGEPYVLLNEGVPFFVFDDLTDESYEDYAPLDSLGRCGAAMGCIGIDLMPTDPREPINQVKPTGWQTARYDFIDGESLYNRCHLIAFSLAGENANERNLITGTRYLNVRGMLPFETAVLDYVRASECHVLYRVTPDFRGDELVARGVLMEAYSVEDDGESVQFCAYCYNVQPGILIDYATGDNALDEAYFGDAASPARDYVLNVGSKRFHLTTCLGVLDISEKNRKEFHGTREELLAGGYTPCGRCKP